MEEIERNMDNIENCEKNAKAYIDSVKVCSFLGCGSYWSHFSSYPGLEPFHNIYIFFFQDYEFQILTYRALQDPIASPLKKPKMECASDDIIQEVGFDSVSLWRWV